MKQRIAELQELLAEPPSVAVFEQILGRLADWPAGERDDALALAEAALHHWPDEERCAGERLFCEGPDGEVVGFQPYAVLVRRLEFEPSHAGCDPSLIELLARAPELRKLTILNLLCEEVEDAGAEAIAHSATLTRLKQLRLGDRIGDDGLIALARSPNLRELELLELRGHICDDETGVILADSPNMAKLVSLDLELEDDFGEDGCWALGMSHYIPTDDRRYYLSQLEEPALRARASDAGIECPVDATGSALIERLVSSQKTG